MTRFNKEELYAQLQEDSIQLLEECTFCFTQDGILYGRMNPEKIGELREIWSKEQINQKLAGMGLKFKNLSLDEEKLLFLTKATELLKAKSVDVYIKA